MTVEEQGGPAFPCPPGVTDEMYCGMSLRDWFAGQALIGIMLGRAPMDMKPMLAAHAYEMADAMLKGRSHKCSS